MPIDANLLLSSAQAVTVTALSTNVKDLGVAYEAGAEDLRLLVTATEAATAAGAATVTVTLEGADDAAITTNAVVMYASRAIPKADIVIGAKLVNIAIPRGFKKRFIAVRYTIGTGPLTAGKFTANIGLDGFEQADTHNPAPSQA